MNWTALPTEILKRILPTILGTITEIVNLSPSNGSFAQDWKTVIVLKILLKKLGLGFNKEKTTDLSLT